MLETIINDVESGKPYATATKNPNPLPKSDKNNPLRKPYKTLRDEIYLVDNKSRSAYSLAAVFIASDNAAASDTSINTPPVDFAILFIRFVSTWPNPTVLTLTCFAAYCFSILFIFVNQPISVA